MSSLWQRYLKPLIKNLLTLLCIFLDFCFLPLIRKPCEIEKKSILLLRVDLIGDYILFRNFIKVLRNSHLYRGYKITLLGNIAWKELAESLDGEFIDSFVWIDRKLFVTSLSYRFKKQKEICEKSYEILISSAYSRDFFFADSLVKIVNAEEKTGNSGNLSNMTHIQKKISDKYYTRLITATDGIIFEFDRNREFFEKLLKIELSFAGPLIESQKFSQNSFQYGKYVVLFVSASLYEKKWPLQNFLAVGRCLVKSGYNVIFCGSKEDGELVDQKLQNSENGFFNYVGRTKLHDLLLLIADCEFVISNDTMAVHLARSLLRPVLVIYNGSHLGRFIPCPGDEVAGQFQVAYHPAIEASPDFYKKLSNSPGFRSTLKISEISIETVIKKINQLLSAKAFNTNQS